MPNPISNRLPRGLNNALRKVPNGILGLFGMRVLRLDRRDPIHDMQRFIADDGKVTIFDVGANVGQTAEHMEKAFKNGTIYSFEPSLATFQELQKNISGHGRISAWNLALGSKPGQQSFFENEFNVMSSLLPLGERGWGSVKKETVVEVSTIDLFCQQHGITSIDILKSDTQGYDLEVFKGAEGMLTSGKIGVIYFEFNFSALYQGLPSFDEVLRYLNGCGYVLEALYRLNTSARSQVIWTDALFVHERFVSDTPAMS